MKKIFFLGVLAISSLCFGQNTFPTTGNVGIGTLAPSGKLDVKGTIKSFEFTPLGDPAGSAQLINEIGGTGGSGGNSIYNRVWSYRDNASSSNWWTTRLHDGISVDGTYNTPQADTRTWWERDPNDNIQSWGNANLTYLTINKGNVGIGTINPDAKLAVNGTIHSKEVKVDLSIPVPDYVFANDYKLRTLKELENYIKENSHLPEIPSAKEIENNGLMLAEMNMVLLKKVEELTLYTIEQEKKNIQLSKELEISNKKIQSILERVDKLENQSK